MFYFILMLVVFSPVIAYLILSVETKEEMSFWFTGYIIVALAFTIFKMYFAVETCTQQHLKYNQFNNQCYEETK